MLAWANKALVIHKASCYSSPPLNGVVNRSKKGVKIDEVASNFQTKLQKKKLTKVAKRFILFLLRGRQTKRFVNMLQAVPNKFFNNQQSISVGV
jgi:hypothetical protein